MTNLPLGPVSAVVRWAARPFVRAFYHCWRELQVEERNCDRKAAVAKWTRVYEKYCGPLPPGGWLCTLGNLVVAEPGGVKFHGTGWKGKIPAELQRAAVPPD